MSADEAGAAKAAEVARAAAAQRLKIARRIAFPVVLLMRVVVVLFGLAILLALLPLWFALLIQVGGRLAGRLAFSVVRGGGTVDVQERIERVAVIWPLGFVVICGILLGKSEVGSLRPQQPLELLLETLLAMLLFTWMFFAWALAQEFVPGFRMVVDFVWPYIVSAWDAVVALLRGAVARVFKFG